ncbi:MAG: NAD(P)/FAD-dependent oxidoreductase [Anaerolineae bacterium]|jgi:NADH dehydrogenase|nr:NAD(P)/FAD-dependent oxidoreductase [Anaerolineae bacterium]
MQDSPTHRVVIIGGGFGGLETARALKHAPVAITLIDRRNFHLFQPLLYQVATAGLSPGEIAAPLRGIFRRQKNVEVTLAEVIDVDVAGRRVLFSDGAALAYDTLIVAAGARDSYFGHDDWQAIAPGLKTVEDALEIRRRVLLAFEAAERAIDPAARSAWLTFVVVGGGPTGVELAGALGEIAHHTLRGDFRRIDPTEATILLIEGAERVLPPFPPDLSEQAAVALRHLGVTVRTGTKVTDIRGDGVTVADSKGTEQIPARTVLWAAGVQASPLGRVLEARAGAALDRAGRVIVEPDLSLAGHPEIFVIGDLAHLSSADGKLVPGVAPAAMQQGRYAAELIRRRLAGESLPAFRYQDKGSLATIGRAAAVASIGPLRLHGFLAWVMWLFIHLLYIVEFESRLLILIQWAWNYFTRNRGTRLITGKDILPPVAGEMSERHPSPNS